MKKIQITLVLIYCLVLKLFAQPAVNPAPLNAIPASQVISIYTDNFYADLAGVNFNPNWSQSGHGTATTFTLMGNNMRHYPNFNYQGIIMGSQHLSSFDTLQLDVWTSNVTSLDVYLVGDISPLNEKLVNRPLTLNSWNRLKIPLSAYISLGLPLNTLPAKEFKFVNAAPGGAMGNIYVDNIFFYTNNTLPTLSNFTIAPKFLGDAPFALTAPASNSTGAFTYTSSNTNVASISGNTVTILRTGTSTITATQAANGSFGSGNISATLSVTVPPISTNAPNPTKPAANVRSIFSNTYPNLAGTNFRADGSAGATISDTTISGNDIKLYKNIDWVLIQLANPTDVSLADSVHISMWTPTASSFALKLVNRTTPIGSDTKRENLVWFDGLPGTWNRPAPQQGQWNVYSLPLSLYAQPGNGTLQLTQRDSIHQILLVGKAPFGDNTYYIDNLYFSSSTNILPVNFKSFDITKKENTAELSWNVASEINIKAYEVEKSLDGKNYKSIATVNAMATEKYIYADNDLANGINYYRIKAVDKEGKATFSETRNIAHNNNGKLEYSIYPNPAKNELVIKNLTGNNTISIVDASGRVVITRNNVNNGLTTLNISTLKNGLYNVIVNNGVENKSLKLVVNK